MDHDNGSVHGASSGYTGADTENSASFPATPAPGATRPAAPAPQQHALSDFYLHPQLYFARLMDATPDGVLICRQDLRVLCGNQKAANHFQYALAELRGVPLDTLIPGARAALAGSHGRFKLETVMKGARKDGSSFPVELHGYVDGNQLEGAYVVFIHDITVRVKAQMRQSQIQEQIDETRRLESIGSLSAGIAHEINTPIQFVGDNLDYMSEALEPVFDACRKFHALNQAAAGAVDPSGDIQEISDALSESREGIKQVRDIVLLMKRFAHPGSGGMATADLNEIVQNVANVCRNRWKHVGKMELKLSEFLPKLPCRVGQIQQVILNLTMNAIDAIEEEGLAERRVCIETDYDENYITINISDTGQGIPDDIKVRIFDPFFTTKPVGKGTGQGLALAKDVIMKGHGGRLQLVEKEGFATTFQIQLMKGEIVASSDEDI